MVYLAKQVQITSSNSVQAYNSIFLEFYIVSS